MVALIVLLMPSVAAPQEAGTTGVKGKVADAITAQPIARVVLASKGYEAKTDATGRFDLALPPGAWVLEVSARGYISEKIDVSVPPTGRAEVEVLLVPEGTFRQEINVVAPTVVVAEAPATLPVKPAEVVSVAGGGENIFRVLQTLPGVTGTDDFGSRLSVRGGGPDQNLTIMDGVEIHNPYRLFGLTSAFNPETVEQFELTAGAFSARYGDRLSSLLVVNNRAGSSEHTITGSAGLSLTDTNIVLEGRLPKASGSWMVTGRRTYYDLAAERFTDSDLPSFNDLQGKIVWKLGGGRTLSLFGLRSREATDASFDVQSEGAEGAIFTRSHNDLAAATFYSPIGSRSWSRTVASFYNTSDAFDFGGSFRDEERRSNGPDDSGFGTMELGVTWGSTVRDRALREEIGIAIGKSHVVETGFEVHALKTEIGFTITGGRNEAETDGSSLQGGAGLPDVLQSARSDTRVGAWFQDRWQLHPRLSVETGLRVDRSTINEHTYASPRIAATWKLGANTRLKGAVGIHRQSPGYEKLGQSDYFMDLTGNGPLNLDSERARHVLVGLEHDSARGLTTRVEGYFKSFDRSIIGRLETAQEKVARIARYDFPLDLAWSVPTESMATTIPGNDGRGRAWGFDIYTARRATSPGTRLTGWASYTFGIAERTNYGRTYPFDYDRRHAVSVVVDYRLSRKVRLSAVGRVASGFPYTPVLGLRVAPTPDIRDVDSDGNTEELVPQRDPSGLLVYQPYRGGINNISTARLPFYVRLDVRATYTPDWGRGHVLLYLDAINAINRKNAGTMSTSLEYDPGADRPRVVNTPGGSIPFLPSLGIHVDFSRPKTWRGPAPKPPAPPSSRRRGFAVGLRAAGTEGTAIEAIVGLSRRVGVRGDLGVPSSLTFNKDITGTTYEIKLPFGASSARLDWHPWAGRFHLSGGVVFARRPIQVKTQDVAAYDIGGVAYPATDVGTVTGTATARRAAPYVGLGWGSPVFGQRRFGIGFDIGVALRGAPAVVLTANGSITGDPAFQQNLAQETRDVTRNVRFWRVFPAVSLRFTYRLR